MTAKAAHDRPWVSAPALVAVIVVLVLPGAPIHPTVRADPVSVGAAVADGPALAGPTPSSVRRFADAQAAYDAALLSPLLRQAITWAGRQRDFPTRTCLYFVRIALQVPRRFPTAMSAWVHTRYRHRTPILSIPPGVPVFTKGASVAGHIAISLGNGWVRTTDWPRDGLVGDVQLTTLLAKWRHRYLGWSEDLNGVRVWNLGPDGWAGSWSAPHRR